MPTPQPGEKKQTQDAADRSSDPVEYPVDYLLGVMNTPAQAQCAIDALSGPFLESEIEVSCGPTAAQRLRESTGRTGLLDKVIRVGQSLGLTNDEMEVKGAYEKALRDGHVVVRVHAPTDDRKALAVRVLQDCGGHFINYFGKFTRERIAPWTTASPDTNGASAE